MPRETPRRGAAWLALIATAAMAPAAARGDKDDLLEFCLDNPDHCAISVQAVDEGWERHAKADRPQTLASTFKILVLLAYAQAVADGVVGPDDTVDKEEWGRYFSGGSSLSSSWDLMGNPDKLRLDDLARVMIVNSDNSAPDLFLVELGKKRTKKATKLFAWHDLPVGISAMLGLWSNANGVGGTSNRIAAEYGGFEAAGYQKELSLHTKKLKKDSFVDTVRESICQQPPWLVGPPPCNPPEPATTEATNRTLFNNHFTRSTTRSYMNLMRSLLDGSLLTPVAQEVVNRNLEDPWFDGNPGLATFFTRYGFKGGSLDTLAGPQILTWAHYMESSTGRYVVVVFLRDLLNASKVPTGADVNDFAQQFALDVDFRARVRNALPTTDLPPELVPQLKKLKLQGGDKVSVKVKVFNTSPASTGRPVTASLFVLDEAEPNGAQPVATAQVKALRGGRSKTVTLKATVEGAKNKFAVVLIDSGKEVREQDEANNLTWERMR